MKRTFTVTIETTDNVSSYLRDHLQMAINETLINSQLLGSNKEITGINVAETFESKVDQNKLPAGLQDKGVFQLRSIINSAVAAFGIDNSWAPPKTTRTTALDDMLCHIDEMCDEFGLLVSDSGQLVRRAN